MKTQTLSIDVLRLDGDTQNRVAISEETVEDYAELIAESNGEWPFRPLDVFHDGNDYLVADGFHRTLAAQRSKRASVPCTVHKGTAKDARIFGMTANDQHGLRMTRTDKRACVDWLLDNGGKMTQAEIAEKAGVSVRTVKYAVAERRVQTTEKGQIAPSNGKSSENRKTRSETGKPGGVGMSSSDNDPVSDGPASSEPAAETTSEDPFDVDPFEEESARDTEPETGGESRSQTEVAPPAGSKPDPEKAFREQRSKTVKTIEALMRAFDDLNRLRKREDDHDWAIEKCKALLQSAKNW